MKSWWVLGAGLVLIFLLAWVLNWWLAPAAVVPAAMAYQRQEKERRKRLARHWKKVAEEQMDTRPPASAPTVYQDAYQARMDAWERGTGGSD